MKTTGTSSLDDPQWWAGLNAGLLRPQGSDFATATVSERIFDRVMDWLDQLQPHKAMLQDFGYENIVRQATHMARWLRLASGVRPGVAADTAMTGLVVYILFVWFQDDSADMAATMAALDKTLKKMQRFFQCVSPFIPVN